MVDMIINHIPYSTPNNRRPARPLVAKNITVHNTGNPTSRAKGERSNLTRTSNDRTASFHWVIDDVDLIECLPTDEIAWHAGDGTKITGGNMTSLSLEICESGEYGKTIVRAQEFLADQLLLRGWGVDRLVRHYDWTGKICPRLMYDAGSWSSWKKFVEGVEKIMIEKLQKDVSLLKGELDAIKEKQKATPAPEWFVSEFPKFRELINTATGTYDFWRSVAVTLRATNRFK